MNPLKKMILALAVLSTLFGFGLTQVTKESQPLVQNIQEQKRQALLEQRKHEAMLKATDISEMGIRWQYRWSDGTWRYYSDSLGRYWFRSDIQGTREYCENPIWVVAGRYWEKK